MSPMASQITSLTIVYSIVYSGVDQRKHQSSASLAFVREIHLWPVNSPHKWPVTWKMFPFDDVIMGSNKLSKVHLKWFQPTDPRTSFLQHVGRPQSVGLPVAYAGSMWISANCTTFMTSSLCVLLLLRACSATWRIYSTSIWPSGAAVVKHRFKLRQILSGVIVRLLIIG